MAISELEKLAVEERPDFEALSYKRPFQMTPQEIQRWKYFITKIDPDKYRFERRIEEAKVPKEMFCTIVSRDPYLLNTNYGRMEIPLNLVPSEIKKVPGPKFYKDTLFAEISVDLEKRTITSIKFKEYLGKMTQKELKDFWRKCKVLKPTESFTQL